MATMELCNKPLHGVQNIHNAMKHIELDTGKFVFVMFGKVNKKGIYLYFCFLLLLLLLPLLLGYPGGAIP